MCPVLSLSRSLCHKVVKQPLAPTAPVAPPLVLLLICFQTFIEKNKRNTLYFELELNLIDAALKRKFLSPTTERAEVKRRGKESREQ